MKVTVDVLACVYMTNITERLQLMLLLCTYCHVLFTECVLCNHCHEFDYRMCSCFHVLSTEWLWLHPHVLRQSKGSLPVHRLQLDGQYRSVHTTIVTTLSATSLTCFHMVLWHVPTPNAI